ncbi:hypothetical protein BUALT_Bualt07G0067700 [Buddleja alternifolia]|uniref:Uncharacterized protein n=1 Tax=Buddleja alternifolia TaxID=168488 RepID=A0AAV6XJH9_9LAMI|nr:hypothetical protein BUALT_Bualt07G0067700 [Buddleja alternifolia]
MNSKMFHLLMDQCENIAVRDVYISAPKDSPNTDGIHIGNSNKVKISNCYIATGDDCISMGAGTTNINISSILCGPGHGISIGSLGKYKGEKDVRGISVRNCTFTNTTNGLRIKTWARLSVPTTVSNVTFADVRVNNVKNPIIIDQFYCPHSLCSHQGESAVQIKGVKFIDIKGSSSSQVGVDVQCSKSKPCQNIQFSGLDLTLAGTTQPAAASCSNANNKFLGINQVPSLPAS